LVLALQRGSPCGVKSLPSGTRKRVRVVSAEAGTSDPTR